MGVYYYMFNTAKKQFIGHLGKIGEFCPQSLNAVLGWTNDNVEVISEHDEPSVEGPYTRVEIPIYHCVFQYAINNTMKQYYDHESSKVLFSEEEAKEFIKSKGWRTSDYMIFVMSNSSGWHERNKPDGEYWSYEPNINFEGYERITSFQPWLKVFSKFDDVDFLQNQKNGIVRALEESNRPNKVARYEY
jgi:hypothetical protein